MNFAIIGAGESSRIRAEGLKNSKHLIKINNEFLIDRIIRIAVNNGAEKVVCIINSKEPELKQHLLSADFGVPLKLLVNDTESSMHSLFALAPFLTDKLFCLATTDSVFMEKEFSDFVNYSLKQKDADGVLAVTDFIDDEKPLCVETDENNIIKNFSDSKEGYNWATGGIYFLSPEIFNEIELARQKNISKLRNFFRLLVEQNYKLIAFPFSKIVDVDHVSDIKKAEELLR